MAAAGPALTRGPHYLRQQGPNLLCGAAAGALLLPLMYPGALLSRDLVVLPHPARVPAAFGLGGLPARNVPQDGVLALIGAYCDATWVVRLLLFSALFVGVRAAYRQAGLPGAAVLLLLPAALERLLQGQWSLTVAIWLLPALAAALRQGRWWVFYSACALCALSPTGLVLATATTLCLSPRRRLPHLLWCALLSLPWSLPSLLANQTNLRPSPASIAFFAPHSPFRDSAPQLVQRLGATWAVLGTGGIWNADLPSNLTTALSLLLGLLLGLLLLLIFGTQLPLLARRRRTSWAFAVFRGKICREAPAANGNFCRETVEFAGNSCRLIRPALGLAALGLAPALAAIWFPSWWQSTLISLPGGGLLRDSSKFAALSLPLLLTGVAVLRERFSRWSPLTGWRPLTRLRNLGRVCCVVAMLAAIVAAQPLASLRPVPPPSAAAFPPAPAGGRTLLVPDTSIATWQGRYIVDPRLKQLNVLASGQLLGNSGTGTTDSVVLDPPSAAYTAAAANFAAKQVQLLLAAGITQVITPQQTITLLDPNAENQAQPLPEGVRSARAADAQAVQVGLAATWLWLLLSLSPALWRGVYSVRRLLTNR